MWRLAGVVLAIVASGAMIVLALPPSGLWPFGWIALAPVFWTTRQTRLIFGVVSAIAATMVAAFLASNGTFYRHGSAEGNPMWIYLGCALFGFVFAVVAGVSAEVKDRSLRPLIGISALGVLLEVGLLLLLPAPLALSQATFRPMLLLASFTGIWGICFLLWLINLAMAEVLSRDTMWARVVAGFSVVFVLMSLIGALEPTGRRTVGVGVVQSDTTELATIRRLSKAAKSEPTAEYGARLVVWPEFGGLIFTPNGDTGKLMKLAREPGMPAFVTSYRDRHEPLPHNIATVFSTEGISPAYAKRKLFGAEANMHAPGDQAVVVDWQNLKIGLNICFDSCYPSIIRDTARHGADIVALPTIDPNSPYGFFAANHAAFTPIRAAENGVSIIRSDGNAFSNIADPEGTVLTELGDVDDRIATAQVPMRGHGTFYRFAGDWFLAVCIAALAWALFPRKRPTESASKQLRPQP